LDSPRRLRDGHPSCLVARWGAHTSPMRSTSTTAAATVIQPSTRSTEWVRSAATSDERSPQYACTYTTRRYCSNDAFDASRGRVSGRGARGLRYQLDLIGGEVTLAPLTLSGRARLRQQGWRAAAWPGRRAPGRRTSCPFCVLQLLTSRMRIVRRSTPGSARGAHRIVGDCFHLGSTSV